jgi:hypothetical protein
MEKKRRRRRREGEDKRRCIHDKCSFSIYTSIHTKSYKYLTNIYWLPPVTLIPTKFFLHHKRWDPSTKRIV